MANKEFKIQSGTISLNGVNLSASADNKVVIPGVTRASGYQVEEVNDTGDQSLTFASTPIVIDYKAAMDWYDTGSSSGRALYIAVLDDGYIDEIAVDLPGSYTEIEAGQNASNDMFVYMGEDTMPGIFNNFQIGQWATIPFRPKMKASGVESEFGGNGGGVDGLTSEIIENPDADRAAYILNLNDGQAVIETFENGALHIGNSGGDQHGENAISIGGDDAGYESGTGSICIGHGAGYNDGHRVGDYSIAIGYHANYYNGAENSITLNATGQNLDIADNVSGLFIKPVREDVINTTKGVYYNATTGELTYADAGTGGSSLSPELTKVDGNLVSTTSLEFTNETYGTIIDVDSGQNFAVWMNASAGDSTGIMYAVGSNDDGYDFVYAFNVDGTVKWKVGLNNIDGNNFTPMAIKCNSDGQPYVAGQYYNNTAGEDQVVFARLNPADGSVDSTWAMTNNVGAWFNVQDITFDNGNNPIVVGDSGSQKKEFTSISPQSGSGNNLLIVNTSDLDGFVPQSNSGSWEVRIYPNDPNAWYSTDSINYFKFVPATAITGVGTGMTVSFRYQQQSNGDWKWDYGWVENNGDGQYQPGDQLKVLGSLIGGTDGVDDVLFNYNGGWLDFYSYTNLVPSFVYEKTRFNMTQGVDFTVGPVINRAYGSGAGHYTQGTAIIVTPDSVGASTGTITIGPETEWALTEGRTKILSFTSGKTFTITLTSDGQSTQDITLTSDFVDGVATYTSGSTLDAVTYPYQIGFTDGNDPAVWDIRGDLSTQAFIWTLSFNWQHTYGAQDNQSFTSVAYDIFDNSIYVSGSNFKSIDNVQHQAFVMKLSNTTGEVVWKNYYSNSVIGGGYPGTVMPDGAGNVFFVCTDNYGHATVYKIDNEGGVIWMTEELNRSGWNYYPIGGMADDGNIIVMGSRSFDNNYIVSFMKINATTGSLMWARTLDNTQQYDMYDHYDDDNQPGRVVGANMYYSGYVYDTNDNYYVGYSLRLPTDGTGVGETYGRWVYSDDTDCAWELNENGSAIAMDLPATDTAPMSIDELATSTTADNVGNTTVNTEKFGTVSDIVGVNTITFADGTTQTTGFPGIRRFSTTQGNNTVILSAELNGQFLHYYGTNGDSYIYVPGNTDTPLPIGYTVTIVIDDFNGNRVYVNNQTGNSYDANINAVGFGPNTTNSWYLGGNGYTGVYTIMKVDTDRWILSGPDVQVD